MDKIFRTLNSKILCKISSINRVNIRTKSKSKKDKDNSYIILRPTNDEFKSILQLMHRVYYTEEPTCYSVRVRPNALLDSLALKAMSENITMVAKCKFTGHIVGACINETTNPWDPDLKDRLACSVQCPQSKHLLHFYAYMQKIPNIWERFEVHKVFEMSYLFIKRSERRKGLALELMKQSRDLAANCGYQLIRVDATSHYTALLCEKLKMRKIYEIPYCAYVDINHKQIFKPPPPHMSVKIYVDDNPYSNLKV